MVIFLTVCGVFFLEISILFFAILFLKLENNKTYKWSFKYWAYLLLHLLTLVLGIGFLSAN